MQRTFKFRWTPELVRCLLLHVAWRRKVTWVIVVLLACVAGWGAWQWVLGRTGDGVLLIALSVVAGAAMPLSLAIQARAMRGICNVDLTITLGDDALEIRTSTTATSLRWAGAREVVLHPRMLLLSFTDRGPAPLVLARSAMDEAQVRFVADRVSAAGGRVLGR